MKSLGYASYESYLMGVDRKAWFIGWIGNQSERLEKVYQKISVFNSVADCPSGNRTTILYNDENGMLQEETSSKSWT